MAVVPLWLDPRGEAVRERLDRRFDEAWRIDNVDRASHFDLFPTLLTLMNIQTHEQTLFSSLPHRTRYFCPERSAYRYECLRFPESAGDSLVERLEHGAEAGRADS